MFSKEINRRISIIQDGFDNLIRKEKINDYNEYKNDLTYIYNTIKAELSNLALKSYIHLSPNEITILNNYFKKNIVNIDDIKINEINRDLIDINKINTLNNLKKNMNIKDKLKFNVTFEKNIDLLNTKNDIENIIPFFDKIDKIQKMIDELAIYFEEEKTELKKELNNINSSVKFIKRKEIFSEFSKEEFIESSKFIFDKKDVNYFSTEINNFYLYIFLLKKDLYHEFSFKSTSGINDDDIPL